MNNGIRELLFGAADTEYKEFHKKLMPGIDEKRIIGVRIPELRKLAKRITEENEATDFLEELPHYYYEENNLHAFLLERIKDYGECITKINAFLPYVDNWATCDSMRPDCFKKNKEKLIKEIYKWLGSKHTYTVRYGIVLLMTLYLDESFKEEYMKKVSLIKTDEYYINMAVAWYFATALAKQKETALEYLKNEILPVWVHNKAIQKATESLRLTNDDKVYLKQLKRNQ